MTDVKVTQADREAAAEADDGAIQTARNLADRSFGASQIEMRIARKEYLAEAFARHRIAALESAARVAESVVSEFPVLSKDSPMPNGAVIAAKHIATAIRALIGGDSGSD